MTAIDTKSDEALLRLIKADSQKALEELFEKYYDRLCDFAFQYVKSIDLSEEIVSDVFLKIWERRHRLNISKNLKGYLYTATRNQALNYLEKQDNELESLTENAREIESGKYHPDEELIFKELENRLEALINTLPPRRKIIFKLSRLEGFTYKEIAGILSISIHTVQNQMVAAVKTLSSYTEDDQ
ncbi:RNA polymerase sigma-70 factor [Halalkalibaculum sp. DA3122]|uniref:RNA polymerase sigma-70 factor n=1 Tax=unclassified Halalkalibaculum TaxID=2964617 RepID=UPI0037553538